MSLAVMQRIKVQARLDPDVREQMRKAPLEYLSGYDLTDDEKQQIVLPHFAWLVPNKIAALSYPETQDAFTLLWQLGIRVLVNLTETPLPPNNVGILVVHIPIEGFTAPTLEQVKQAISILQDTRVPIGVHCVAGLGRTGTILACYLVRQGISATQAMQAIRAWRFGSIETVDQEAIIYEYEKQLPGPY